MKVLVGSQALTSVESGGALDIGHKATFLPGFVGVTLTCVASSRCVTGSKQRAVRQATDQ